MAKKYSASHTGSSSKKRGKKAKKTKKAKKGSRPVFTNPLDILQWFVDNADAGVKGGVFDQPKKHFAEKVYSVHGPKMLDAINHALNDLHLVFDEKVKKGTGIVAHDMGKICRMLYAEDEISEDQFDAVRIFVSHHHAACKKAVSTGGGGDWCDY